MSAPRTRILIAGIGNIFLGDDAFGVEVVHRLARRALPDEVRVVDFGIRGIDLTYALLDDYESVILIDAAPRGGKPGTLYLIEPETPADAPAEPATPLIDMHSLDPAKVLNLARTLGGGVRQTLLVGCEPLDVGDGVDVPSGLSEPVAAAVDEAVEMVETLIARLLDRQTPALVTEPSPHGKNEPV